MFARRVLALTIAPAFFLVASPLLGDEPQHPDVLGTAITYEGQLSRVGVPVNGPADFQFSLWDAPVKGARIGSTVARPSVEVADGRFTTELNFRADVSSSQDLWLQIASRNPAGSGEFTTFSLRHPLIAVPARQQTGDSLSDAVANQAASPERTLKVATLPFGQGNLVLPAVGDVANSFINRAQSADSTPPAITEQQNIETRQQSDGVLRNDIGTTTYGRAPTVPSNENTVRDTPVDPATATTHAADTDGPTVDRIADEPPRVGGACGPFVYESGDATDTNSGRTVGATDNWAVYQPFVLAIETEICAMGLDGIYVEGNPGTFRGSIYPEDPNNPNLPDISRPLGGADFALDPNFGSVHWVDLEFGPLKLRANTLYFMGARRTGGDHWSALFNAPGGFLSISVPNDDFDARIEAPPIALRMRGNPGCGPFMHDSGDGISLNSGRTVGAAGNVAVYQPFILADDWLICSLGLDGWYVQGAPRSFNASIYPEDPFNPGRPYLAVPLGGDTFALEPNSGSIHWVDVEIATPFCLQANTLYFMGARASGDHWSALYRAPFGLDSFSIVDEDFENPDPAPPIAFRMRGNLQNCPPPPPAQLKFFTNEDEFRNDMAERGKLIKFFEDFEESVLPPASADAFDDPLGNFPNLPDGFPYPEGIIADNLLVQSNTLGGSADVPSPAGADGLAAASAGFGTNVSDVVITNIGGLSTDLIFRDRNKTGIAFNPIRFFGPAGVEIKVFDIYNRLIGEATVPADEAGTNFIGMASSVPIGRINIWDPDGGFEGADNVQMWFRQLLWFNDPVEFRNFNVEIGKNLKIVEDLEESILPPNSVDGFDDPLGSFPNLPDAFPYPDGILAENLEIQSNIDAGNPVNPNPRGVSGLAAGSAGFLGAISDVVVANSFAHSLDMVFTSRDKTAVGFDIITLSGGGSVEVRAYDTNNNFLGMVLVPADPTGANFVGLWAPARIGRINVFDPNGGAEGGDNIQMWFQDGDLPDVNCEDLTAWGFGPIEIPNCSPTHTWTVINTGTVDLNGSIKITGADAGEFDCVAGCGGFNLPPNDALDVTVRFCPTSEGPKDAFLTINSNDPDEDPCRIHITGDGGPPAQGCDICGPGPHWIHDPGCPAGTDNIPNSQALVGIDLDLDCQQDTSFRFRGPVNVDRTAPLDDSVNFPGTRPVDGHIDVIDTEIVSMILNDTAGSGFTLIAGDGFGNGGVLPATLGNIAEDLGDPNWADSFFNVMFEVNLGGGQYLYNHEPLIILSRINCLTPERTYVHPDTCLRLFDDPRPGHGEHVANLVTADHSPFPDPICIVHGNPDWDRDDPSTWTSFQNWAFSGFIDPAQESSDGTNLDRGFNQFNVVFNRVPFGDAGGGIVTPANVSVEVTGGPLPTVVSVTRAGNILNVELDRIITLSEWTTLVFDVWDGDGVPIVDSGNEGEGVDECARLDVSFQPTDVNNSNCGQPLDLSRWINSWNSGMIHPPDVSKGAVTDYTDISRNGTMDPIDVSRLIAALKGQSPFTRNWRGLCINNPQP